MSRCTCGLCQTTPSSPDKSSYWRSFSFLCSIDILACIKFPAFCPIFSSVPGIPVYRRYPVCCYHLGDLDTTHRPWGNTGLLVQLSLGFCDHYSDILPTPSGPLSVGVQQCLGCRGKQGSSPFFWGLLSIHTSLLPSQTQSLYDYVQFCFLSFHCFHSLIQISQTRDSDWQLCHS